MCARNVFQIAVITIMFFPGSIVVRANDAPPPFRDVLLKMIELRNSEDSFAVEYTHTRTDLQTENSVLYKGKLFVLPNGFRHERTLVEGSSPLPGTQGTHDKQIGKKETVIVADGYRVAMGLNGPHATKIPVVLGTSKEARPPFDPRGFGLGFVGDVRQGWSLERTASNFLDWNDPVHTRWAAPGVAEYDFGDCTFQIDIRHGYWPVGHQLIGKSKSGGQTVKSGARVTLKESEGNYRPVHIELWTDKSLEVYELAWLPAPKDDVLDFRAAAKSNGVLLKSSN